MWLTRDNLPKSVRTETREYLVDTDFRAWIKFENMMIDGNIDDRFRLYFMLNEVMMDDIPTDEQEELMNALFSFYRMDKPAIKVSGSTEEIGYRFDHDMDLIYAAFQQQYSMNLLTADLHWWEFKSLFNGLTDKTKFIQVIGYRTADLSKMDKEQKREYQKLKKFYALPKDSAAIVRTQQEIEQEILKQIEKGGDS